jgi:hypothetical protein
MRSWIVSVSKVQLSLVGILVLVIAVGMLVGGNVGFWMQVGGWGVLATAIVLRIGINTTSSTDRRTPRQF